MPLRDSSIHNHFHNYISIFFDHGLIVMLCFFFFLFFAILAGSGRLGSYLQELSHDTRSKLARHLSIREDMIRDLLSHFDRSLLRTKKIVSSCSSSSHDILSTLQFIARKSSDSYASWNIRKSYDSILHRTNFLPAETLRFFTDQFTSIPYSPPYRKFVVII